MAETEDDHRLIVSLEARIATYEKALQRAQRETSKRMQGIESALKGPRAEMARFDKAGTAMAANFSKSVSKASTTLSSFATGVVAGGAFAVLTSLSGALGKARQSLSDFEDIANQAQVTGLSTTAYQAISFGAIEADINQEKLNAGLAIFAKNMGLAQQGTGALYNGLRTLNPELLKAVLSTTDQDERLRLVAEAMKNTTDATKQAALATTVFGKGGVEMARVLDGGAAALDDFRRRAAALGLIIPDDLLRRSGELDDKLEVLSTVIDVNLSQALVNAAPLLVKAAEGAAGFAKEVNEAAKEITAFAENPNLDTFLQLIRGSANHGLLDSVRDAVNSLSSRPIEEINADIAKVQGRLADLKIEAAAGFDVQANVDRAMDELKGLQDQLRKTAAVGVSAANQIRASFAQAFRESEIVSMAALAKLKTTSLPQVTRYGGNDKDPRPAGGFNTQQDVNGSGVSVTKPLSDTAKSTKDTADNVQSLNDDTGDYFDTLGSGISTDFTKLGGVVKEGANATIQALAGMYDLWEGTIGMGPNGNDPYGWRPDGGLNTGNISKPSTMFGDQWDPEHGSHVGNIINLGKAPRPLTVGKIKLSPDVAPSRPVIGNIVVGDINVNGVQDGATAGRQAAYEFVKTVYGALSSGVA
ncbi:hypothetical protein [Mesorhizobium sp. WSM3876]|uniref:hypothetical protein n=1 Tax=Mesorhizobium sp. WSM3876 TaxID=422277 RepID=UPI000BB01ED8|nr:hypothetical protein [Mesorhizobium sp. WSM3876]PBB85736.1 hypothetical protein CK216_16550 [Mesorhizobium sp. WSM3876]